MGLDTVELLISFEKEFGIDVPDYDAEQMATIGDVTLWFCEHLKVSELDTRTHGHLRQEVLYALKEIGIKENFQWHDPISSVFPQQNRQTLWKDFSIALGLKIPQLNRADLGKEQPQKKEFKIRVLEKKRPAVTSYNFERLIEWIGVLNYKELLIDRKRKGVFEVLITVMFLTYEKSGAYVDELLWDASFTSDLGLD